MFCVIFIVLLQLKQPPANTFTLKGKLLLLSSTNPKSKSKLKLKLELKLLQTLQDFYDHAQCELLLASDAIVQVKWHQ